MSLFYLMFLSVFALPLIENIYVYFGFKDSVKQLDVLEVHDKKDMKQYHIDITDREHLRIETENLRLSDSLDYYVGLIIVIIIVLVIRKKYNQYKKKREKIKAVSRLTHKWKDL